MADKSLILTYRLMGSLPGLSDPVVIPLRKDGMYGFYDPKKDDELLGHGGEHGGLAVVVSMILDAVGLPNLRLTASAFPARQSARREPVSSMRRVSSSRCGCWP